MKKVLKYLGISVLSIVIFFVAIGIFLSLNSVDNEKVFVPYIEQVIPELTKWERPAFKNHLTDEALATANDAQWNAYLSKVSELGNLQAIGTPEFQNSSTKSSFGDSAATYATYLVPVTFDTGLAHIQMTVVAKDGNVKINHIKFMSDILMR